MPPTSPWTITTFRSRSHDRIFCDFGRGVIDQLLLVIVQAIGGRVAHDLHYQIRPLPGAVVTSVEVVSVQEDNIRQAVFFFGDPQADAVGKNFAQFPLVDITVQSPKQESD